MPYANKVIFSYTSEPGEWIGQGRSNTLTSKDCSVRFLNKDINGPSYISLEICPREESEDKHYMHIRVEAPKGRRLRKCENIQTYRFSDTGHSLDVTGGGRGHSDCIGSLTIKRIRFSKKGKLVMLDATFENRGVRHDNQASPALTGSIYYYQKPEPAADEAKA